MNNFSSEIKRIFGLSDKGEETAIVRFTRMIMPILGESHLDQVNPLKVGIEAFGSIVIGDVSEEEKELSRRAISRMVHEEIGHQKNIESVVLDALHNIEEEANSEEVDKDWLNNFFAKSRLVSDGEMQKLWSHILAGEVNRPGEFSVRTINLLSSLNKQEALLFKKICTFCWLDNEEGKNSESIMIFPAEILKFPKHYGIWVKDLYHLQDIGLVLYNDAPGTQFAVNSGEDDAIRTEYHKKKFVLKELDENGVVLPRVDSFLVGGVKLTLSGVELARICSPEPNFSYMEYMLELWRGMDMDVSIEVE